MGEARSVVAGRYRQASEVGPERNRLEELGCGLLLRYVLGVRHDSDLAFGEFGKPRLARARLARTRLARSWRAAGEGTATRAEAGRGDAAGTAASAESDAAGGVGPRLDDDAAGGIGLEFNLSNDVGLAVLAVSARPIGVDIENVPAAYTSPVELVARKYYSEEQRARIGDGSAYDQRVAWAQAWTRMEAILKARGTGFSRDPRKHPEALDGWELWSCERDGCVITVAVDVPFEVELHEIGADAALDALGP